MADAALEKCSVVYSCLTRTSQTKPCETATSMCSCSSEASAGFLTAVGGLRRLRPEGWDAEPAQASRAYCALSTASPVFRCPVVQVFLGAQRECQTAAAEGGLTTKRKDPAWGVSLRHLAVTLTGPIQREGNGTPPLGAVSEDGGIVLYKCHRLLLSCTSCLLAPTEQLLGTKSQTGSWEWTGAGTARQEAVRETLAASVQGGRLRGPQPQ